MSAAIQQMKEVWERFGRATPYNAAIGMDLVMAPWGPWSLRLPYRAEFVGDPESGVLHGGMISALLDVTCAFAVFSRLEALKVMATLDLRIDYLRPATPGKEVFALATCHKITSDLAFVRGAVHHDVTDDLIATGVGIYIFTEEAAA